MSGVLDSYSEKPTMAFTGKVKGHAFHQTVKGELFTLVYVTGVEKPLAIPQGRKYEIPNYGDHVSALDVTEGVEWFFLGHRSIVVVKPPDFEVWQQPSKVDAKQEEQAEAIILNYLKEHDEKGCSPNDVRLAILNIFPNRDRHIVGIPFLRLSKKKLIHKYGELPSDDKSHHGSDVRVWHLTEKGREYLRQVKSEVQTNA